MDLTNLALTDSSMVLPVSIGCTMGMLQYLMYRRNEERDARISKGPLIAAGGLATVLIAYFSLNWSIGFNLYILSNLSSYVLQTTLMDNNTFRGLVGLKRFNELQPDIRKLQIAYHVMRLTAMKQVQLKKENAMNQLEEGDNAQSIDVIAMFSRTWVELLRDKQNFTKLGATEKELNAYLRDIQNIEESDYAMKSRGDYDDDDDDEEENDEEESIFSSKYDDESLEEGEGDKVYGKSEGGQKYAFEFLDREGVAKRREQIRQSMGDSRQSTREYLMAQKMQQSPDQGTTQHHMNVETEDDEYEVKIHDVDGGKKKRKKKKQRN